MAEILIKAVDAPHYRELCVRDRDKADAGCYRKGDIVEVREDGRILGKYWYQSEERPPKFIVVKVPDAKESEFRHYQHHLSVDGIILLRRKWRFPAHLVDLALRRGGIIKMTAKEFVERIEAKWLPK